MSELKAYLCIQAREIENKTFSCYNQTLAVKNAPEATMAQVYLKDEADEYIGELKKERDWLAKDRAQAYDDLEKRAQLNIKQEESIRHQKYKRCLAMAMWCKDMSVWWNDEQVLRLNEQTGNAKSRRFQEAHKKFVFFFKWNTRWLKIAEQFKDKEAK